MPVLWLRRKKVDGATHGFEKGRTKSLCGQAQIKGRKNWVSSTILMCAICERTQKNLLPVAHPTHIDGWKIQDLAQEIGNLRYDKLAEFLEFLGAGLADQAKNDRWRNRVKLAYRLHRASISVEGAKKNIDHAWKISKPFMVLE